MQKNKIRTREKENLLQIAESILKESDTVLVGKQNEFCKVIDT